ncbi:tRNA lysidine(34) synthetase TilS [Polynucleobacter sp. HIN5]|uniref:tRNA lysidine(34) synthetase TilS n=1 Tax=Polynucleobacter sp. HIN5 TaxID=3047864 RepID=UPI00257363B4|nr:tRNA lysidine(34) synthetase TilS [Polynucleobacter sp. HIN5]BEI33448.1 tRNA lysidine(34) synthetase TilS [Polynucleobacter sp. HIN5]
MASSKKSKSKTQAKRIGVAFSGGLDSVVLLDAVSKAYPNDVVYALHVHHGLQAQADEWLLFCERQAKRYKIAFDFRLLHLPITANIEAHARQARYEALLGLCDQYELDHLLFAHHQHDQAETVLLQLLRGAGPAGLAGMPAHKELQTPNGRTVHVWRPLLEQDRTQLKTYAKQHKLSWVEDPSNQNTRYRRNAIRKKILPELEQIQGGAIANLARSAQWLAQSQVLMDQLAQHDARTWINRNQLTIAPLIALYCQDPARATNVMRYWLKRNQLSMPSTERLQSWWRDLQSLRAGAKLEWLHDRHAIRAWRNALRIESAQTSKRGQWIFVPIPERSNQAGLSWEYCQQAKSIESRPRAGGERLKIKPNTPSKSLKNLYQEAGVPPWQRQIPLLFIDGTLIAAEGLGVSITHLTTKGPRVWPEWSYLD